MSSDPLMEEARELINRMLDDELSPEDAARLERIVCDHPEVREHYILHTHLWCNLAPLFTASPATTNLTRGEVLESEESMVLPALSADDTSPDDEPEPIELPPLVWPTPARPNPWPRRLYTLGALAATVLLASAVALFWPRDGRQIVERLVQPTTGPTSRAARGVWEVEPGTTPGVAQEPTDPVAPAAPPITAVLASAVGAEWAAPHAGLRPGQKLGDETLVLNKGLAEIRFEGNGVSMIVEGPARLRIASDMRADLHGGKLVATVPQPAIGFVVETSSMAVVDLGTEFGVEVDAAGATRVEVFQGKVQANPPRPASTQPSATPTTAPVAAAVSAFQTRQLTAGEAGRVEPGAASVEAQPARPLSFVRDEEFEVRTAAEAGSRYHRWLAYTYELRRDPTLALYYTFPKPAAGGDATANVVANRATYATALAGGLRPQQFDLALGSPGGAGRPAWAPGRWVNKGALDFQAGARHGALLDAFPYSTNGRLTVAAWVYARNYAYWGAIAKNRGDTKDTLGQFSLGLFGDEGTLVGRVQQDDGVEVLAREPRGWAIPLGQWVHVAMVADGTTLRVYRDGAEVASAPCTGATKTPQPHALAVGFRAGPNGGPTAANRGEHWDGCIDELAIFHRALRGEEIRTLYEAGRP